MTTEERLKSAYDNAFHAERVAWRKLSDAREDGVDPITMGLLAEQYAKDAEELYNTSRALSIYQNANRLLTFTR